MSAKARFKSQIAFQKLSSAQNLFYPYLPHKLEAFTIAQKMLLSPEISYEFRENMQNMVCIDIRTVARTFLRYGREDEDIFKLNLSPVYPACFLYVQTPDFIYNSETGTREKWGRQECAWGVQHYALQIPPTSEGYRFTRALVSLPEKQPRWFEQVH